MAPLQNLIDPFDGTTLDTTTRWTENTLGYYGSAASYTVSGGRLTIRRLVLDAKASHSATNDGDAIYIGPLDHPAAGTTQVLIQLNMPAGGFVRVIGGSGDQSFSRDGGAVNLFSVTGRWATHRYFRFKYLATGNQWEVAYATYSPGLTRSWTVLGYLDATGHDRSAVTPRIALSTDSDTNQWLLGGVNVPENAGATATELRFVGTSTLATADVPFTGGEVRATDSAGVVDTTVSGTVTLTPSYPMMLKPAISVAMVNGVASVPDTSVVSPVGDAVLTAQLAGATEVLVGYHDLPVEAPVTASPLLDSPLSDAFTINYVEPPPTPVVADRWEWSVQPGSSYEYDGVIVGRVKAVMGNGGPTQTTRQGGSVAIRFGIAPAGVSTTYVLDSGPVVNGEFAFAFNIEHVGGPFTLVATGDQLLASPDSAAFDCTLPAGDGTYPTPDFSSSASPTITASAPTGGTTTIGGDLMQYSDGVLDVANQSSHIRLKNDDATDAALTSASAGLVIRWSRGFENWNTVTPAALGSRNAAWTLGGIFHLGGGNHRIDLPAEAYATATVGGDILWLSVAATGVPEQLVKITLEKTRAEFVSDVAEANWAHADALSLANDAASAATNAAAAKTAAEANDTVLDKLNAMLELSGSDYRFTSTAVALAPSGAGVTEQNISDIASAVLESTVEGTFDLREVLQLLGAFAAGKLTGATAIPGSATLYVRNLTDTQNAITMVTDENGNRTAVTITPTP